MPAKKFIFLALKSHISSAIDNPKAYIKIISPLRPENPLKFHSHQVVLDPAQQFPLLSMKSMPSDATQ